MHVVFFVHFAFTTGWLYYKRDFRRTWINRSFLVMGQSIDLCWGDWSRSFGRSAQIYKIQPYGISWHWDTNAILPDTFSSVGPSLIYLNKGYLRPCKCAFSLSCQIWKSEQSILFLRQSLFANVLDSVYICDFRSRSCNLSRPRRKAIKMIRQINLGIPSPQLAIKIFYSLF